MSSINKRSQGCCCGTPKTFVGCFSLALPNYSIEIWSANPSLGGILLETVTTSGSGIATVASTGVKWVRSADLRFTGQSISLAGSGVTLTAIGSAYTCIPCCGVPIKKVLSYTSGRFGAGTVDFTLVGTNGILTTQCGGICAGTDAYVYLGFNNIGAGQCFMNIFWSFDNSTPDKCVQSVPPSVSGCGGFSYTDSRTFTCPPAFSYTGSVTLNPPRSSYPVCYQKITGCTDADYPFTDTLTLSE